MRLETRHVAGACACERHFMIAEATRRKHNKQTNPKARTVQRRESCAAAKKGLRRRGVALARELVVDEMEILLQRCHLLRKCLRDLEWHSVRAEGGAAAHAERAAWMQ